MGHCSHVMRGAYYEYFIRVRAAMLGGEEGDAQTEWDGGGARAEMKAGARAGTDRDKRRHG